MYPMGPRQGSTEVGVNPQAKPCKASAEVERSKPQPKATHHRELAGGLELPTT